MATYPEPDGKLHPFNIECLFNVGRPDRTNAHKPWCQVGFLKQVEADQCPRFRPSLFQLGLKHACAPESRLCPLSGTSTYRNQFLVH